MVTLNQIISFLEELAPPSLAEDYDNVGLLLGNSQAQVERILISLDVDEKVVAEAVKKEAQLILSHHPLIFRPVKNIVAGSSFGRTIYAIIQNNVNLYAMHTNFDIANGGLCDYFLQEICHAPCYDSLEGELPNGLGRIAKLETELALEDFLNRVKKKFSMQYVRYIGEKSAKIQTVAVCNGGGADLIELAKEKGADVYISGDVKYHQARYAYENGLSFIEIPHYEAEIIFCRLVSKLLSERFQNQLEIMVSEENVNPWKFI